MINMNDKIGDNINDCNNKWRNENLFVFSFTIFLKIEQKRANL